MLFYYAKRKGACWGCGGDIVRNDFCVKQFIKNSSPRGGFLLTFHYDCFLVSTLEHIRKEAVKFVSQHYPNKKMGRPPVYTDGKKADSLKHSIKYFREHGNTTRMQEAELELAQLIRH